MTPLVQAIERRAGQADKRTGRVWGFFAVQKRMCLYHSRKLEGIPKQYPSRLVSRIQPVAKEAPHGLQLVVAVLVK